jgi:acyl-coenzyme A thioesterase PaaI-like protein
MFSARALQRLRPLVAPAQALTSLAAISLPSPTPALATPKTVTYRPVPKTPNIQTNHAIYEKANSPKYTLYVNPSIPKDTSTPLVLAHLKFGSKTNGHRGIVHGGIASLLFDDAFGFAYFFASGMMLGYTANLTVNYRNPLPENSEAVIRVFVKSVEGRKVHLVGRLESEDGQTLYSEASALYIIDRSLRKLDIGLD